ncbi:MAG: sortase [Patescibacteria group bacterium]
MIYLVSFIVINWNDVSWIFNYRTVSGIVSDFLNPYPSVNASSIFYLNNSQNNIQNISQPIKEIKTTYTDKQNTLEIPKISISVPMIFSQSTEKKSLIKDLDKGVVYYPGSVLPGQTGQIIILGHSAPPGWPKVKHDWVFSELNDLNIGDSILIDLDNKQYTYIVKQKLIIDKGADVPAGELTLVSCWPPGKDYKRIVVQAELDF